MLQQFEWIVATGAIFAFFASFGIGANDVANAFATSVGSGALKIKHAIPLAAVCEFSGSLFMGSHVVNTIRKGISDQECFVDDPGLLMYGCLCVILSVAMWLILASYLEMPVSTTHSCVGGIIGMTMVARGSSCVTWLAKSDQFPYVKGVTAIIISWLLSPIISGLFASALFFVIRSFILRSEDSYKRIQYGFPILVAGTFIINTFFIVYKGAKFLKLDDTPLWKACAISFGIGGGAGIFSYFFINPIIFNAEERRVEEFCHTDDSVQSIHDNAEVFDSKTEYSMRYLQILTACCDSFAHGANDVANSIGPFAAIYAIYKSGEVSKKADMGNDAYWILSLGAGGIVVGLATYGYKILEALGTKMAKLTPSRGICIELGAAAVIILGSRLGWPLSTTHCQVGATVGVALFEGVGGVNWKLLGKTVAGWLLTLVVVGGTTALLFAQGAYAPMVKYPSYVNSA
jgi:sodium-dependent phosphate transporter